MNKTLLLTGAVCVASLLTGCAGVGIGVGATTTASVFQERSTKQAVKDSEIRLSVGSRLLNESETRYQNVFIEVVEGRVLLTGEVPYPQDRIRAAEIVWDTPGVNELINEVEVGDDSGLTDYARDVWIATRVRAELLTAPDVDAINYNVETVDGAVHLMGVARDEDELVRVVELARGTPGVKRVVSHVLTKTDRRRARG